MTIERKEIVKTFNIYSISKIQNQNYLKEELNNNTLSFNQKVQKHFEFCSSSNRNIRKKTYSD